MAEQGCERLDWDSAEMHNMTAGGSMLVVRGVSLVPMDVELHSLPIPIAPEDYHGVEVCGRRKDVVQQVETPWEVSDDVEEFSGRIGIELIGATKREKFPPETA